MILLDLKMQEYLQRLYQPEYSLTVETEPPHAFDVYVTEDTLIPLSVRAT